MNMPPMDKLVWAWAVAGFVLGTVLGSFLATLIIRLPEGRSVLSGRSACDSCGRTLRAADLVPLGSFLLGKGRCRHCGDKISRLHPAMELGCGVLGATAFWLAPGPEGLGWALFAWMLLTLAVLDYRHFWLPDALTVPLAFLGFTVGMWTNGVVLADRVIGAAAGYGGLMLLRIGYLRLRGREGMGGGDPKLLGALGAWLGWQSLPFILLIASVTALVLAVWDRAEGRAITAATRMP